MSVSSNSNVSCIYQINSVRTTATSPFVWCYNSPKSVVIYSTRQVQGYYSGIKANTKGYYSGIVNTKGYYSGKANTKWNYSCKANTKWY